MRQIILVILIALVFAGCSKKENELDNHPLNGEWTVVDYECLCNPAALNPGDHNWSFDIANNKLAIENIKEEHKGILHESGNYEISLSDGRISFNKIGYNYYFEEDKLYLDSGIAWDSPLLELIRN